MIKFLDGENLTLLLFHKQLDASIQTDLDQKIYDVVGTLSVLGYQSEAFYRVKDFKSEIAIVPISARSGVGIPELLSVLVGLTQQYLQKRLNQEEKDPRKSNTSKPRASPKFMNTMSRKSSSPK